MEERRGIHIIVSQGNVLPISLAALVGVNLISGIFQRVSDYIEDEDKLHEIFLLYMYNVMGTGFPHKFRIRIKVVCLSI